MHFFERHPLRLRASCSATPRRRRRETFERLCKALPDAEVLLLTGRVREREAARIRARLLDPETGMTATRPEDTPRPHHLIVVATQTLEVGADIDAEYLVTEGCSVRALTQRLGRLNRFGRFPCARATYVHAPPPKRAGTDADMWPVYRKEPATVLDRLKSGPGADAETVNLSAPFGRLDTGAAARQSRSCAGRSRSCAGGPSRAVVRVDENDNASRGRGAGRALLQRHRLPSVFGHSCCGARTFHPRADDCGRWQRIARPIDVPLKDARETLGERRDVPVGPGRHHG